jgi:CubicO group peptidase (beta-lactamase class C family)
MSTGGLSRARLDRMHDVMARHVERGTTPGLVTVVSRRGDTEVHAIGSLAVGGGGSMEPDSIFRISSMTKPVTAVAAMIIVEECKLRLDDPVDDLLPELANRQVLRTIDSPLDDTVPAHRPITLRDLLTFRLGFGGLWSPDPLPIEVAAGELELSVGPPQPSLPPPPDEWMRRLGTLPLMYQPGERWMYNTGSDVLGVLIARASGQPLETFLRERIFEPLGMSDTSFSVPAEKIDRFTTSYATMPESGLLALYDEPTGQWSEPPAFPAGSAGLVSTAVDYLAFGAMMLGFGRAPGGERILSRPSVATMTSDHLTPEQKSVSAMVPGYWDNHGWGFGVSVVIRRDAPIESVGKYGWDGGMGTTWSSDPAEEMVTILMTPAMWTSPSPPSVCRDFWTAAYGAIDD